VAVGVEAERQLVAQLLLDVVAVLLCLLTANRGITTGPFGFDHRQRFAVFAEQGVITELVALVGRARFRHAFAQGGEDVEFLDNLRGVFDVPTREGELLVNQL
jgi:hypothetical protein